MKKVISFFSFAVLVTATCMMTTSCSDDHKDSDKGSSNAKALVGRWLLTESREAGDTEWEEWNSLSTTRAIQFDENGTYGNYLGGERKGTSAYVVEGKKIILTYADNSTQTYEIRQMSKDKNSMELLFYKSDGKTPKTYYRYSRCPKDAAEARQMLMAQWMFDVWDGFYDDNTYDATYLDFSKEGKKYKFRHYRKDLSPDDYNYKYRGKYICWDYNVDNVNFTPDKTDPTKGICSWSNDWDGSGSDNITHLCYQSMLYDGDSYIRVEKPITYDVVEEEPV